jgi:hypothetical protein
MINTIANFLSNVGSKTWSTAGSSDRSTGRLADFGIKTPGQNPLSSSQPPPQTSPHLPTGGVGPLDPGQNTPARGKSSYGGKAGTRGWYVTVGGQFFVCKKSNK